jgi:exopolysaccharide biosynthesis polyprenyl glycosylphosphotransferase
VLVRVAGRQVGTPDTLTWSSVVDALASVKRDSDQVGWLEHGRAIGMLVPEIRRGDAHDVELRVSRALASCVGADANSELLIRVHRYSGITPDRPFETAMPISELHPTRTRVYAGLKRILDVVASTMLLALVSPLFLAVAALVKLTSRGPVFFKQPRVGQYGKPFTMLKFRTMHVNADSAIHKEFVSQLIQGVASAEAGASQEAPFKIVNDPRITSIGRFLRRTSLDELPQFWNVLRGDMSLVGPRPPLGYEVEQYKPWHYRRLLEAKPGITGLWQVSGRSQTTFDDMVRLDLRYAKKCSAWMDVKILLATPRAVISGKGAR